MQLAALVLAAAPALVAARGSLGFALGDKKADGTCKFQADYAADFKTLGGTSKLVRGYAASDCNTAQEILPAAKAAGFQVILGIWPDTDESYAADKAAVVKYAPQYADQVYAITVGSETMYRGNFTGDQLLAKIKDVKSALGGKFKVGTADSWNKYQDGTADPLIKGGADILLCNAFSYWQGQTIANSTGSFFDDVMQAFGRIQSVAGSTTSGPELWVGEVGWPTAGDAYQNAVPGTSNAQTFWQKGICGILDWGVNVFSFEAFDEPWKPLDDAMENRHLNYQSLHIDIQTTSSLLSSPPPAATAEDGPGNLPSPRVERPASPAFSTSSTADEGGSSPILPPLPVPTFRGRSEQSRRTPSHSPTASSHYYTASWGSPYQQPPASIRTQSHANSPPASSEPSEDSPIRHLEFHTPFLRPAPTFARLHSEPDFVTSDGLISAAVLANRARRPATGLTEDWIRQHTGGEAAEANNWLSDDPGDSEHSSLSGSISGDARDWLGRDDNPRTPTLKTFLESRETRAAKRGHRRHLTTETLKQEDFSDAAIPNMSLSNVDESKGMEMELQMPTPEAEQPPPPPPKEWRAAALPAPAEPAPVSSPPRIKKKVPWKGKSIMVLLPRDDGRGQKGNAPKPISVNEVAVMMKEWEQLGYDTTGFNLGPESDGVDEGSQGQSRSPWPLIQDMNSERHERSFRISIPDRREWDAYVQELKEAKLRALGVSFGDEDPAPTISPAVSNLSRRTSTQYPPLPFSPPLPTSSANSSHLTHHPNPFSPVLVPGAGMSTSQSSNPGSVASPASMHAHMQGKYNPRQSVSFTGAEHPFGSPFQYPQQQSPGVWSPQQMLYQQGHARGGSPSLHNLGAMVSPASPFSQDGYFPQNGDVMSQMQQRQQILQTQLAHQQQLQLSARASPRLQELRETEDEDLPSKSPSKTPEARQIKHNPSASLQKEIDDAEYHLEEQFQRQLEHEDYSPHSDKAEDAFEEPTSVSHTRNSSAPQGLGASRYADDDSEEGPILHHPQPHSRGHSLSQRPFQDSEESAPESKSGLLGAAGKPDLSDIETNPSNLGTPIPSMDLSSGHERALSAASNPWADSEPNHTEDSTIPKRGHAPKPSMSKLNVAAKEFKFDPSNTFKPNQFAFGATSFQPPAVNAYNAFAPPVSSATSSHFSHHSVASSKGRINVGAPAFTPGQSEFSFSASGPSFRPDAPAFTPQISSFSDSMGSGSEGPRTSIFGSIDLSALGISKPTKKSKAIPIVRPDSSQSRDLENETMEGKDGRITQGEGRFKRAKGDKEDGDSVPLFADNMPLGETTREQSPPKENVQITTTQADKENSAPLGDSGEEPASAVPVKPHTRDFSFNSPESGGKDFAPWEFDQRKQAEDFNAARPFTSKRYGSGLPAYGNYAVSSDEPSPVEPEKPKGHKKNASSLSATAKPFEFRPNTFNFTFGQPSDPVPAPVAPISLPKTGGLSASRYARSPTPPTQVTSPEVNMDRHESMQFQASLPGPQSPPTYAESDAAQEPETEAIHEQTVEKIDDILHHMNQVEQSAPPRDVEVPTWLQQSPQKQVQVPDPDNSSPIRLLPQNLMRSDAPSPSPRRFHPLPGQAGVFGRVPEDPFEGEIQPQNYESPVRRLGTVDSLPPSEWDDVLSETEEAKLQPRAQFFDNHVNELVGGLLAERLDPLERTLESIQMSIDMMASHGPSSRRDRRSISGALSDADDEDDDNPRRSLSPRRDKKMEKIRAIVTEVLNAHQPSRPQTATAPSDIPDSRNVLLALEEMKEQFGASMRLDLRGEDLRNIVEEAVERRMPATPKPYFDEAAAAREAEYRSRIADLEEKLIPAKPVVDEAALAREAEYKTKIADLEEKLLRAESDSSSRIADLEERLGRTEDKTEQEITTRRAAEDRLAEVQRLLRISSEEEVRLREAMDEREIKIREIVDESDMKVRSVEEQRAKTTMRIAFLEAAHENSQTSHSELQNRINITDIELREARQETQRWQMETERALEAAKRHSDDAEQANETNKELRRTIDRLRTQMEESIRVREGMRGKLMDLQEDMAKAARDISEENARRAKKEAELVARQEVLDAKLQAEARTRERLETEIERLEAGEREGMRAVNDAKKLDLLIEDLRAENQAAHKEAMRYKREFEEARESGLAEVQRTTHYMQGQVEAANNQVNVVREDLEHQLSRVRAELDQVKLEADTARAKNEMLFEEVETTKQSLLEEMKRKHADAIEDIETQHKRQLNNALEDAERSEQHFLERLSLSSAKTEHLQDRVAHLEEKLEIANQAAAAAATAAKTARSAGHGHRKSISRGMELPEKISPQALRESIMVLQEQLQDREAVIEQLEATVSTMDLDAPTKISKRDDEIMWLRELLAVRKGDLQDIVQSLEAEQFDAERVRDAAIRLRANLQMEEQERERAMNGGSAISLPNIASSLRDVASSPRVAQAVGPLAAAWGNWRKGRSDIGQEMQAGHSRSSSSTPNRASPGNQNQSFLSGLLTPPASTARQGTPPTSLRHSISSSSDQPTAFGSTGQRMTISQLANQPRTLPRQPVRGSPAKSRSSAAGPSTPPMMRKSSYDADARAEDFSDAGFYDDDESTVDDGYGSARREGKAVGGW
ncbi:hypothetical protein EG329_011975 [Mollisiaceae sp. DMI_Dod_QoI]|nr:hypothetical protein EG329_011975 [Helotiales sp. DMI_Dod_QoI]